MAEFFSPNYVHPDYATPEQLAQQRAYADALIKRSGEPVNRPAGAIANMIERLTGALEQRRANELQQNAAAMNAGRLGHVIQELQRGGLPNARNMANIYADPMASPSTRDFVQHLIQPQKYEDAAGRPGFAAPSMGVRAAPVAGLQPGVRQSISTADSSISNVPEPAPPIAPNRVKTTPIAPTGGGVFGGTSKPLGWDENQVVTSPQGGAGPRAAGAAPPGAPAPAAFDKLEALAAKGRELAAERERAAGGAKGEADVIKQDIVAANDAPNVLKGVGTIKDNIQRYGDKITFGPTSPWSLELKRAAANYAPGLMKNQLEAIAAADSINKVGIGLAGVLASQLQGGQNAETFQKAMQGVPGLTTSKEGALAMADMIQQSAQKSQQLGGIYQQLAASNRLRDYQAIRQRFLTENPVINPLTRNPIEMDMEAAKKNAGYERTATNPQTGERMGYRNGQWELIK